MSRAIFPRRSHDRGRSISPHPAEPRPSLGDNNEDTPRPPSRPLGAAARERSPAPRANEPNAKAQRMLGITGSGSSNNFQTSAGSGNAPHLNLVVPPRSQSRAESLYPSRETAASPIPSSASSSTVRTSPQKTLRSYDSKLSSTREKLGIHPAPSTHTLAGTTAVAASASTLSLAAGGTSASLGESRSAPTLSASSSSSDNNNPLSSLHVHVLPLFNGEPLYSPIEDLNVLVRKHLQAVVSRSPPRAIGTLEADVIELMSTGMLNLNAKLTGLDDDKLILRIVELWGFFWSQVLPYVEGVLLPLQTDPLLLSLSRPKNPPRPSTPDSHTHPTTSTSSLSATSHTAGVDIRRLALRSFRNSIIYPLFGRLYPKLIEAAASGSDSPFETAQTSGMGYHQPRLQQMLLVLASISCTGPFSSPTSSQPDPAEVAISQLLRAIRRSSSPISPTSPSPTRTQNSLYGYSGVPRDRRGRIGFMPRNLKLFESAAGDSDGEDAGERNATTSTSTNGEGDTVVGSVSASGTGYDDDDEGMTNWDEAQEVVERMVGLKAASSTDGHGAS